MFLNINIANGNCFRANRKYTFYKNSIQPQKTNRQNLESDKKLETFPGSHQDRLEGKYAGKGYKQLLVDNYMAIYKIDETEKTVYVITVQYQRRNM